ncbi:subtilisin-like protease SBT3.13 [Selaginella moellendorffii]|uniref:subtilisin-like protease SBT3.13 n=1 Tax=Selaginella moellendorffii TaxID=88036 RepID=UPI000D1CB584|nr:subtilisin-like protease SBT3.13 [Selaginella moellendorffii]|eukprot:XP_024516529.1 subtilisin-like protease SBT3.13 [Selaginella moellendorffii]
MALNFQGRDHGDTHIVYLGNVDKSLHPEAVTSSHHALLRDILGSDEAARESLGFSYRHGFSGFSARLTEEQAAKISSLPNVLSIFPNKIRKIHTTNSWEFLGLYGSGENSLFGASESTESSWLWHNTKYGKDVIIGVFDSGVWPESKSFLDHGMKSIPKRWKGTCETGEKFNASHCNKKLIGARFFSHGLQDGPEAYAKAHREILSPRDVNGHGTHTASTAGGRFVRNANWLGYAKGTAKGGAPDAHLAIYKICWRNITDDRVGCPDAHVLSAFDMGIHDGVDIISASFGGPVGDYFLDSTFIGAFHAMQKGIVVVASAGNSQQTLGPGSVENGAPWIITVGASTLDRAYFGDLFLGNNESFRGFSFTEKRLRKRWYHLAAGANVGLPTSSFSARFPVAQIQHQISLTNQKPAPLMAAFSSSGPNLVDADILKPDITAPGVHILAAYTQFNNSKVPYKLVSGTSMSCPHVSGIVALLKSYRPTWSPAAIKSAIVTTGYWFDNLSESIKNSSLAPASPFDFGGGHVNPNAAAHPGLVYDADEQDYIGYLCSLGYNQTELQILTQTSAKCPDNPTDLNYPSIAISNLSRSKVVHRRVTNVDDDATNYTASIEAPESVSVSVHPSVLRFEHKGETKAFQVIFRVEDDSNINNDVFGKLIWSNGKYMVTSPIAGRDYRRMWAREIGRAGSSAIVLASKNKSRKKNVEDDFAAYTTAALPLLEEYTAGYSMAVLEKKKKDLSSNLGAKETLQHEKSSSKKSSLEEFLKGKVRPLDEAKRKRRRKTREWKFGKAT